MQNEAPVLFIVFARPEYARITFEAIKKARPKKLYFYSNIARKNNLDEIKRNTEVRSLINEVDWECDLKTFFRNDYVDSGMSIATAISWAFETTDRLIIIEEDCVPALPFFDYCDELLERYKNDTRIWTISGNQYNEEAVTTPHSYFFSKYGHSWGWATWKRCWQEFDIKMKKYPLLLEQNLQTSLFRTKKEALFFNKKYEIFYNKSKSDDFDTWDFQFSFALTINSHICIVPTKNLVKNIGYVGLHTKGKQRFHDRPIDENYKIISHPDFVLCDVNYDAYHFKHHWNKKTPLFKRIIRKIEKTIRINK